MLEKVRKPERAKNILAYLIFGAICLVFVFMGDIPNQLGLSVGGPAALVNKEPISFADYRETYSRLQSQYKGQLDFLPAAQRQMYMDNLRSQALEILINSQVVSQAAKDIGLYVSDEEVRDYIVKIPAFNEDEKFRRERYDNYLSYRKISAEKFEKEIRKEVVNSQVRNLMQISLEPSQLSAEMKVKLEGIKMNLEYAKFPSSKWSEGQKIEDADVTAFIAVEANSQSISDYYNANKEKYNEKEQVKARHILVKFEASKAGDKEKALEKVKEIQAKLATEDFAKLATEYSDDPGSKTKGGDLGFFTKGKMVPAFEKVAFSAELNKVSEPVETQFGYHLIKVEEKKAAQEKTLEDVKSLVAKEVLKEKRQEQAKADMQEWIKDNKTAKIESWLKSKKVKWEETGEFKLDAGNIPKLSFEEESIDKIMKTAASGGSWVNQLIENGGQFYLVKVKSYKDEEKAADPSLFTTMLDVRKNQIVTDVFGKWADQVKETAQIERNPQVLAQ